MAHYNNFQELDIFILSRSISKEIWSIINNTRLKTDFELRKQINRSSGSVMDNIAEGFGRGGNREFINFLGIAKGSCCETQSQLMRCLDREYISQDEFDKLYFKTQELIDQIGKFITYLKKSEKKGYKFD